MSTENRTFLEIIPVAGRVNKMPIRTKDQLYDVAKQCDLTVEESVGPSDTHIRDPRLGINYYFDENGRYKRIEFHEDPQTNRTWIDANEYKYDADGRLVEFTQLTQHVDGTISSRPDLFFRA